MTQKEFALEAIAPYYKNPSICGMEEGAGTCSYLTKDNRMCVAAKYMQHPEKFKDVTDGIVTIITENGTDVFRPEVQTILDIRQWEYLQKLHDAIAKLQPTLVLAQISNLNLFSLEELEEYCKTLN